MLYMYVLVCVCVCIVCMLGLVQWATQHVQLTQRSHISRARRRAIVCIVVAWVERSASAQADWSATDAKQVIML